MHRLGLAAPSALLLNKLHVPADLPFDKLGGFVGGHHQKLIHRKFEEGRFNKDIDDRTTRLWQTSRITEQKQQRMVEEQGVEAAIAETLNPSKPSWRAELRARPLNRAILEEIYRGMHGKRAERRLRKGVHWERFTAQNDSNAPITSASERAQQTFAYGGQIKLVRSARSIDEVPTLTVGNAKGTAPQDAEYLPEVAFIGRTNGGRSSLINTLLNAQVCKFGDLPGTTTSLDFVSVADKLMLVDCPGYGYVHPLQASPLVAGNMKSLLDEYLALGSRRAQSHSPSQPHTHTRPKRNIRRVFVCISSGGAHHSDVEYWQTLEKLQIPFGVIMLKTDTQPIRHLAKVTDYVRGQLSSYTMCKELMLSSALRLAGIHKIQTRIGDMALRDVRPEGEEIDFTKIVGL